MNSIICLLAIIGIIIQGAFIIVEHKEKYVPAVVLKGSASLCFVIIGLIGHLSVNSKFSLYIFLGLIFGLIGDVLLNLRYVFTKIGQKVFLAGILAFLIGHVLYLLALLPKAQHTLICVVTGLILSFGLLAYIFKTMDVKMAFKIFGVFYLSAVIVMTVIALGIAVFSPSLQAIVYAIGAVLFTASDIVLIFNTFSGVTKFSLRITNLSLYYLGQLLIAFSLLLLEVHFISAFVF